MSAETPAAPRGERLISLDAFRGATIAAMFLVNNAGDWGHVFAPLKHADWNGCTATDLVFPFFLFIMGVAMTYSSPVMGNVLRRTVRLSLLNALLALFAWGAFLGHFRFYGVLQRIAFCYFFASLIILRSRARAVALWAAGLLAAYACILRFAPVPGHGAGVLERYANIVDYVDSRLMLPWLYEIDRAAGVGHDPEGLLSTLGAISTTLSGVLCGHLLRRPDLAAPAKAARMTVAGMALLAGAALWGCILPFNKNLWTPSYVLLTSGWAFLGLALFYWIIDVRGCSAWARPFIIYGANAIAAYVGVGIMSYSSVWIRWQTDTGETVRLKTWLYQNLYHSWLAPLAGERLASASWGAGYVVLWCWLMWLLYRRKIFIKV